MVWYTDSRHTFTTIRSAFIKEVVNSVIYRTIEDQLIGILRIGTKLLLKYLKKIRINDLAILLDNFILFNHTFLLLHLLLTM